MRAAFKWRLQNGIYGYLTDETNKQGPFIYTIINNKREYYDSSSVDYKKTDDNKISSLVSKLSETDYKELFTRFANMIQNKYPEVSLLDVSYYYNMENDECVESAASLKCQATDILFSISGVTAVDEKDAFVNIETINSDTTLGNLEYAFNFGLPIGPKGDKGDNGLVGKDGYNVNIDNVSATTETIEHIYDAEVNVNDSERFDNNTNTYLHTFGFDFKIPRGKGIDENGNLNNVNNITIKPSEGIGTTIEHDKISITQEGGTSSVLTNSSLTISSGSTGTTITNTYVQTSELKDNTIDISSPNTKGYWYAIYSGRTSPSTVRLGISKDKGNRPFEYYIEANLTKTSVDTPFQIGNLTILNGFLNPYNEQGSVYSSSASCGIKKFRLRVEMKETISPSPKANATLIKDYSGQWFIDVLVDDYGTGNTYTMSNVQGAGTYISFKESNNDSNSRLKITENMTPTSLNYGLNYGYKKYNRDLISGTQYYFVTYEVDAKDGLTTNNLHSQQGVYTKYIQSDNISATTISGVTITGDTINSSKISAGNLTVNNNLSVGGTTNLNNLTVSGNLVIPSSILNNILPIGSVIMWAGVSAPDGWLKLNDLGKTINKYLWTINESSPIDFVDNNTTFYGVTNGDDIGKNLTINDSRNRCVCKFSGTIGTYTDSYATFFTLDGGKPYFNLVKVLARCGGWYHQNSANLGLFTEIDYFNAFPNYVNYNDSVFQTGGTVELTANNVPVGEHSHKLFQGRTNTFEGKTGKDSITGTGQALGSYYGYGIGDTNHGPYIGELIFKQDDDTYSIFNSKDTYKRPKYFNIGFIIKYE